MLRFIAICLVVGLYLIWPSFGFVSDSLVVAQSTYGSIVGTVSDETGARIGGATVEIINAQTGLKRTVYTDADGNLLIINLEAGLYEITVSAPYFQTLPWPAIQLLARQTIRFDFTLSTSGDCISIDVPGTPTTTDTPTISDSKSGREINALALNFRATNNTSPIVVATLAPGVQQDRDGNISIAGSLPYMTSVSIDGISTLNSRFNGPVRDLFPSVESIAEFKVSSFNNSAEFGQVTDLTTTSRSGQNEFYGSAFWFHQNRALNATDPFAPSDPARPGKRLKPALVANSFGGNLSGPISIPNFYDGRNRSFFFFNYEGVRRPNQTLLSEVVPPDAFRTGDLSSISTPLINPFSGQPFARNQVPVNPTSARILELLYPRQNQATGTAIQPNFVANVPGAYGVNGFDLRGDHAFSERKTVFVRYSHKNVTDTGTDGTGSYNLQNGTFSRITEVRNLAGSFNWIFTPKVLNEFRAGLSRSTFRTTYPLAADGGDLIQSLGLTGLPPTPASGGIPNFNFTDGTFISTSPGRPRTISNRTIQLADTLSWVKGRHTLKFGVDYQYLEFSDILTFFNGDEFGEYNFTGQYTGNAFADFLLGLPASTTYAQNGPDGNPFTHNISFFVQDEIRMTPKLTVNLGLRYELHLPFKDKTNQLANFDRFFPGGRVVVQNRTGLGLVAQSFKDAIGNTPIVVSSEAGFPEALRETDKNNFNPRIGLAYRPFDNTKTVVRGGFGVYTVTVLGSVLYSMLGVATSNAPVFSNAIVDGQPVLQFPNVFPTGQASAGGLPDYRRANQVNLKDPYSMQWSLTVEQELTGWTGLRLSYTGQRTINLVHSPDLNQVTPNTLGYDRVRDTRPFRNFNAVLTRDNGPSATYHAFTAEVSRKLYRGFSFQTSYTWAKNLSNALGPAPTVFSAENGPTTLNYFDIGADYGNVPFTRRHRFLSTFLWELPFGNGRAYARDLKPFLNALVSGWQVSGITLFQSGAFLTPTFSGTDPSGTGVLVRGVTTTQRPDRVGNGNLSNPTREQYFDPNAFVIPGNNIGRFGNAGVGILQGPGTKVFSLSVAKKFNLTERVFVRYEATISNLLNHTNLDIPSSLNVSSPSFGRITSTQSVDLAGPRTVQMSLRVGF